MEYIAVYIIKSGVLSRLVPRKEVVELVFKVKEYIKNSRHTYAFTNILLFSNEKTLDITC